MKYMFSQPLIEGLILERKNRFVMGVEVNGVVERCHCPCTGRIGNIIFKNIPCLLVRTDNIKTKYTVEAISLNKLSDKNKKWIGINQVKANRYVEFLLETDQLPKILKIDDKTKITREKTVGKSRLDFVINDNIYLEVKSPLIILPLKKNYVTNIDAQLKEQKFTSHGRFFKHLDELSNSLKIDGNKSIMILFYMFEADKFVPPKMENEIAEKVYNTLDNGVKIWQVNCKFDRDGVELVDYYKAEVGRII
jgi:sugar fermentation stimulation protein A